MDSFYNTEAAADSEKFSIASQLISYYLGADATVVKAYDFDVMDSTGSQVKTFDGTVNISFLMPEDVTVPDGKSLVVYRFEEDGHVTACDTTIDNGYVVFATNESATYALVVK